jgi:3-deoxy-7-phosphoheptulonate synthase
VDCSHANSGYDPALQPEVCVSVAAQRRAGRRSLVGVMIESNLCGGKQRLDLTAGSAAGLRYGVSVTDGCVDWATTVEMINELDTALA